MTNTNIVTDSLGRKLEIKNLTAADQFDLLEAAQNQAEYQRWFSLANLVFSCTVIDGVPLPMPRKPADFKKNAMVLKDEGLLAIAAYLADKNAGSAEEADAEDETMVKTAKN